MIAIKWRGFELERPPFSPKMSWPPQTKDGGPRQVFSNGGSRPQIESLGNLMRVAAERWGHGVDGVASNVEETCMKWPLSNITCSARLRQKLYDSDDILFFILWYLCEGSLEFFQVKVWGRRKKALLLGEVPLCFWNWDALRWVFGFTY